MSDLAAAKKTSNDLIPQRIKILWSSGALGVAFMMNVVAGFVLVYMITVLKIEPAIAGFIAFFRCAAASMVFRSRVPAFATLIGWEGAALVAHSSEHQACASFSYRSR